MSDVRCHWVEDKDVPGGRFLVPGCWSRVIGGDDAECHCDGGTGSDLLDEIEAFKKMADRLAERVREFLERGE